MRARSSRRRGEPFYLSKRWRFIRLVVLRRDGYRCTKCAIDVRGVGKARVDHIKPRKQRPDLAYDLANLRTLCPACDNQAHREKGTGKTGDRDERIVPRGADHEGNPLDPEHHWNQ